MMTWVAAYCLGTAICNQITNCCTASLFLTVGGEFWALSYGRDVTREIHPFDLLPNRADVRQALNRYGVIHTFSDTFYNYDLEWWRKRLGPIHLSSLLARGR
jgi:hypothetical protein